MDTREKFTAIIPVLNEIDNIEEVIASVDFADEIFVVDSYSTDGTYEKALSLADKAVQHEFKSYANQKNWAMQQAKYNWILLVDADERVTPELKKEIQNTLKEPVKEGIVGYWIGRNNHFIGEPVNHGSWGHDRLIRLFQRDKCQYGEKHVHEKIIANGELGHLKYKLYHNTSVSLDDFLQKKNHYSWLQAKDYDKKTGRLTGYHFIVKPFYRFLKHYIMQGGFRDGVVGLTLACLQSHGVFMRYVKLWLLRKNKPTPFS